MCQQGNDVPAILRKHAMLQKQGAVPYGWEVEAVTMGFSSQQDNSAVREWIERLSPQALSTYYTLNSATRVLYTTVVETASGRRMAST